MASAAGSAYAQLFEVLAGEDGERLAIDVVGDHHLLILLEGGASPHYLARHLLLRPLADVDAVKRRRVRGCARAMLSASPGGQWVPEAFLLVATTLVRAPFTIIHSALSE